MIFIIIPRNKIKYFLQKQPYESSNTLKHSNFIIFYSNTTHFFFKNFQPNPIHTESEQFHPTTIDELTRQPSPHTPEQNRTTADFIRGHPALRKLSITEHNKRGR